MLTVEEALQAILERTSRLPIEHVRLENAYGRVLAADVFADTPAPPFDNSAVDGYAVRAADTENATPANPAFLKVIADIPAGVCPTVTITPGTAAKIMTGAPVPDGADAIIMVEDTKTLSASNVALYEAGRAGQHIRKAGEEMKEGALALHQGALLRAPEIGLLATTGNVTPSVFRLPKVAIISTGDEVVEATSETPPRGKIRNSNQHTLATLAIETGALLHSCTHLPDDLMATEEALRRCADPQTGANVIVTAGGVSVGERDFVKPALEALGSLQLWKVAMKPGKPVAFGRIDKTLFFGLPGNPVSALVTFELFVRPALWKMMGRAEDSLTRPRVQTTLLETISHTPGRREYVRAQTSWQEGRFVSRVTGAQGSGMLRSMIDANSLLVIPAESEGLSAGAEAEAILLRAEF